MPPRQSQNDRDGGQDGAGQGGGFVEGALYFVGRNTYDERGDLVLSELSDSGNGPGPVGVVFRRGVNSYDERGRQTSSKWYKAGEDEPSSAVAYAYDERGNRVKIDSWRTKPDMHSIQEFSYDAEGRQVGTSFSDLKPDGWKTSKSRRVTTVEGGLTVVRSYSSEGAPLGRTETLKDERGNLLSEELYRAHAQGEDELQWKATYRYDERGFLREVVYHKAEPSLGARAVYEYDSAGNWVKFVSFIRPSEGAAPVPQNVVRRRITYY